MADSAASAPARVPSAPCTGAPKRIGMVIELRPEVEAEYRRVHSDAHAGVRDLLEKWHYRSFTIWLHRFPDGKLYEFASYLYSGTDYEGDSAGLNEEPRNKEWLAQCDPMQIPLPGTASGWTVIEEVYFNQ
jgi:L-rhamnose mutarotase